MWKSGISIFFEAPNHYKTEYDQNRILLMRLMIVLLSQPLFHSPDEYLVVLNPFSTYLTNRRCKNVKNLFVSLINVVISYDCAGYVSLFINFLNEESKTRRLVGLEYEDASLIFKVNGDGRPANSNHSLTKNRKVEVNAFPRKDLRTHACSQLTHSILLRRMPAIYSANPLPDTYPLVSFARVSHT